MTQDQLFDWARTLPPCSHEERTDVLTGPSGYQNVDEVCVLCGDVRKTARVVRWA